MKKLMLVEILKAEGLEKGMQMAEAAGLVGMMTAEEILEAAEAARK